MRLKKKKRERFTVSAQWFKHVVAFWFRNRIKSVTPSQVQPWRHPGNGVRQHFLTVPIQKSRNVALPVTDFF